MSKVIERIKANAEALAQIRVSIDNYKEDTKKVIDALELEKASIQALLLTDLRNEGLTSIKSSTGESYSRMMTKSLEVTNELQAFKWAYENRAVSINKTLVKQKLKDATEVPVGFEMVESEYISCRKAPTKAVKFDEATGAEIE